MSSSKLWKIKILRYTPDQNRPPEFGEYEIPFDETWSLLDALAYVKDELDGSLAYRWSCRMAVCGSCGMVVNGVPKLACETFIRDYFPGELKIEPLKHFDIERDLIVDHDAFIQRLDSIKPYIIEKEDGTGTVETGRAGEWKQTPKQLAMFKKYSMCINCLLCYSACPQFGLNPGFLGPAALTLAHRYNDDSRDHGREARMDAMNDIDGVWRCTFVGYCSEVCPKQVDPASALQLEKVNGLMNWGLSKVMPHKGKS
jgi:fumarate reductase iron-sulfur subunit